jgi:hypothetical protein
MKSNILHSAGYHYHKSVDGAQLNRLVTAQGLHSFEKFSIAINSWTQCTGQVHRRQRKIMSPARSGAILPSIVPQDGIKGLTFGVVT